MCEFRILGEPGGQRRGLTREHAAVGEVPAFESLGVDPVVQPRVLMGQNQCNFAVIVDTAVGERELRPVAFGGSVVRANAAGETFTAGATPSSTRNLINTWSNSSRRRRRWSAH